MPDIQASVLEYHPFRRASLLRGSHPQEREARPTFGSITLSARAALMLEKPPPGGPSSLNWRLLFYAGLLRLLLIAPIPTPITPIHACKARG